MGDFMTGLENAMNYTLTENGAITYASSQDALMDLFAMGGAYRNRSDEDVILLFKNAFEYTPTYALRCLFYLRDIRGKLGQGERRFFRVCLKWLADTNPEAVQRNIEKVVEYGRWDDLYCLVGTKCEQYAFELMRQQLALDVTSTTPSLLAKWLKSENTSSVESRALATKTRKYLGWTPRQYRKTLSALRERIKVVERLMSLGRFDEIQFDKIPSKAGFIYRNAFARRDMIKAKYEQFIKDEDTKVNADTLYPYEVVAQAYNLTRRGNSYWGNVTKDIPLDDTERVAINKYWNNLREYFDDSELDALCVIDTSGSMWGPNGSSPINVAISLGLYAAEKAKGPFHGHYISFSSRPQLIKTEGVDFVDKVRRIYSTNLCENTNIEATFDLLLDIAQRSHCTQEDLPKSIVIVSDMEFDAARRYSWDMRRDCSVETLMETLKKRWEDAGYTMPNLVFWQVDARHNNIPMKAQHGVTLVSGFSPSTFQTIMSGKSAQDFMMSVLNDERYADIH